MSENTTHDTPTRYAQFYKYLNYIVGDCTP
jgi:hypothetical protein